VRHVLAAEQARLREIRLASLVANPDAFGSTYARDLAHPQEWWDRWAARSQEGRSERTFVLVDDDDRWLGLAFARFRDSDIGDSDRAWLGAMWVAPQARRRGGASLLCEACIAWARARGVSELILTVVADNEAAKRVYTKAGFIVRERAQTRYYGRTLDELVMSRSLEGKSSGVCGNAV
jgi:RimJ/RimL family protein N-acetyltransferase